MQELLVWHDEQLYVDCTLEKLHSSLQDQHATVWLDLQIENEGKLDQYKDLLKSEFQFSQLTLDTIEGTHERARLVEQHGYFYLVVHGMAFDSISLTASAPKLDIIFSHNFLVTIHRTAIPSLTDLLHAASNDPSKENIMHYGVARVLHQALDSLVDSYFPVLDSLDEVVDELENTAVTVADNEVQSRLFRAKRAVALLRRVISPQIEVMNSLITRTGDFIPTEAEPYFADVHAHLVRTFEVLDSYRDLMSGLLDVYLTTISNRMNAIMKQLTIIATIFLPITFITGVFGQNFGHSPQVEHDNGYNFWIALILMAVVTLFQIAYFKYRKWI